MKNIIGILILIGLFGCSQSKIKTTIPINQKIKGNWKTEYFNGDRKKTAYIFTFQDSTCSYLYPWGEFSKYWIAGDTLKIKEKIRERRNNISGGKIVYEFLIDSISSKTLFLKPLSIPTKELFRYEKAQNFELIKLSKIQKYRNWNINRIGFYSTGCFGTCPSMYLEIDSIGNFMFYGKRYTKKDGFYSGTLSKKELELIISDINKIKLDSLEKMYSANWTDDQTCGVSIKTKERTYESSAYGFNEEPIELRILFHRLMELYKNVELKKDTTIVDDFQFKGFQYKAYPPPPPPPPINNELNENK